MKKINLCFLLTFLVVVISGCAVEEKKDVKVDSEKSTLANKEEAKKEEVKKEEVKKEVSKDFSKNWMDNQVQLKGKVMTLPIKLSDLNSEGFELRYSEQHLINPGSSVSGTSLTDAEGNSITGVYSNLTDKVLDIKDSSLTTFSVSDRKLEGKFEVVFPGDIKFGDSFERVKEAYGEPKKTSGDDEFKSVIYANESGQKLDMSFSKDKLISFYLKAM